jgi:hypothetical protein
VFSMVSWAPFAEGCKVGRLAAKRADAAQLAI